MVDRRLTEERPRVEKKAAAEKAHLALNDESGLLLNPLVRRS